MVKEDKRGKGEPIKGKGKEEPHTITFMHLEKFIYVKTYIKTLKIKKAKRNIPLANFKGLTQKMPTT